MLRELVRGCVAGAVGTAAMTVAERLEMSVSGRQASEVPGQVAAHLLPGRDPSSGADVQGLTTPTHWAHGITLGAARGALDVAGLDGSLASAVHFATVWGGDALLYARLGVAPPPWRWQIDELASDVWGKGVYALVTGAVYDALSHSAARR